MRIGELYGSAQGHDVYICGTGPSMRVFPIDFLRDKLTIGLNQFWRYLMPTYNITVHPELLQECYRESPKPSSPWVVKKKPPMHDLSLDDDRFYVFHTSDKFDTVVDRPADTLFIGRGVQQTAMDLAARMGASTIILVGVDMTDLGGEHHGHDQHVRFHGLQPADVYMEYRKFTAEIRWRLREKFNVQVLTLSPLLGANAGTEDYLRLCKEHELPRLPKPKDTSSYSRKKADL